MGITQWLALRHGHGWNFTVATVTRRAMPYSRSVSTKLAPFAVDPQVVLITTADETAAVLDTQAVLQFEEHISGAVVLVVATGGIERLGPHRDRPPVE